MAFSLSSFEIEQPMTFRQDRCESEHTMAFRLKSYELFRPNTNYMRVSRMVFSLNSFEIEQPVAFRLNSCEVFATYAWPSD